MFPTVRLRITLLRTETDVWCDPCGVPSAVTITYALELFDGTPTGLHRLTYCEGCEGP